MGRGRSSLTAFSPDVTLSQYYYVVAETIDPVVHHPCDAKHRRVHDRRKFVVTDEPRGRKPVKIEFRKRSYKCLACEARGQSKLFKEELPHIARGKRQTERLFQYLVVEGSDATFRKTAKRAGISDRNAGGVFHRVLDRYRDKIERAPRVLGIDEKHLGRRKRGIIVDIGQRRLLAVTDDDLEAFREYLRLMPGRELTEYVTLDMREGFISMIGDLFPNATIIVDKYHVWLRGNKGLSRFIGALRERKHSGDADAKRLLFGAARLLSKHMADFKPHELERVAKIFKVWPDIEDAYYYKEEFTEFYDAPGPETARNMYLEWELNVPFRSQAFFKKHTFLNPRLHEYVFNYFIGRRTNAFTENRNRKLADIARDGRALTLDTIMDKALFDEKRIDISSDPLGLHPDPDAIEFFYWPGHGGMNPADFLPAWLLSPNHPKARRLARRERFLRKRRGLPREASPPRFLIIDCCRAA